MIDISIEELIKLREQRLSYEKIERHLRRQGINVSITVIKRLIKEYYRLNGKEEPITKKEIDVDDEELVRLREEGLSYEKIARKMREKGISISLTTVDSRITEYYQKIGKEVIKKTRKRKQQDTSNEKVEKSQENISNREIEILQAEPEDRKEAKKTDVQENAEFVQIGRTGKHYDNTIKYILMNGMTVNDFIAETGEPEERERIKRVLKKLIFLAWHSEENERTMVTG